MKSRTVFLLAGLAAAAFAITTVMTAQPVPAQTTNPATPIVPLGYCQLTSVGSATKLSACSGGIPAGATMAYLEIEAQAVRYRDDGTAPTTSVGMPIASGGALFYAGTLSAVQIIEQTSGAKVNVLFYR